MEAVVKNGNLVISIPLNLNPQRSKSGKTLVVATSNGNKETDATVEFGGQKHKITIGLNAYFKAEAPVTNAAA